MIHELTHTRQLVGINRQVRELAKTNDLPLPINDDVVQARFGRVAGFERAFRQERDLFYQAAALKDPANSAPWSDAGLTWSTSATPGYFTGSTKRTRRSRVCS